MKDGTVLQIIGAAIGALAALRVVYAELDLILTHWIALIVLGFGAVIYFVGVYINKKYPTAVVK